jgi:hypothetical protein
MDVRPHNGLGIQSFRAIMDIRRANGLLRLQAQFLSFQFRRSPCDMSPAAGADVGPRADQNRRGKSQ